MKERNGSSIQSRPSRCSAVTFSGMTSAGRRTSRAKGPLSISRARICCGRRTIPVREFAVFLSEAACGVRSGDRYRPWHPSELKANANATFAAIGVHGRSPALRLRVASAGKLVGKALQLAVKPFEFNDFFQEMILVQPQIAPSCESCSSFDSFLQFQARTLLPDVNFVNQNALARYSYANQASSTSQKRLEMKSIVALTALLATVSLCACAGRPPLSTVPTVDLQRYSGRWYEIARYPNWFQRGCAGSAVAEYTPQLDDGSIKVVNSCPRDDGSMRTITGRATVVPRQWKCAVKSALLRPFRG